MGVWIILANFVWAKFFKRIGPKTWELSRVPSNVPSCETDLNWECGSSEEEGWLDAMGLEGREEEVGSRQRERTNCGIRSATGMKKGTTGWSKRMLHRSLKCFYRLARQPESYIHFGELLSKQVRRNSPKWLRPYIELKLTGHPVHAKWS